MQKPGLKKERSREKSVSFVGDTNGNRIKTSEVDIEMMDYDSEDLKMASSLRSGEVADIAMKSNDNESSQRHKLGQSHEVHEISSEEKNEESLRFKLG